MPNMTRRDAYLLDWGCIHAALGGMAFLAPSPLFPLWVVLFSGSGVISVLSAFMHWARLQIISFVLLSVAASARALYHLYLMIGPEDVIDWLLEGREAILASNILGVLLWTGVCVGQVIVAGWRLSNEDLGAAIHDNC